MRYRELVEKIVNIPHRIGPYIDARIKEFEHLDAELERISSDILAKIKADSDGDTESTLRYIIRAATGDDPGYLFDHLKYNLSPGWTDEDRRLTERVVIKDLIRNLKAYKDYGVDWGKYVLSSLDHARELPDDLTLVFAALPHIEKGVEAEGYETEYNTQGDPVRAVVDDIRVLSKVVRQIMTASASMKLKFTEMQRQMGASYSGRKYRTEHDEVETLYHATAYASEIASQGFSAERPIDRQGVGNFGSQNNISFTHSLEIAHSIARSLKEIWMIAHGQLSARTIIGWMDKEGILREYPDIERTIGLSVKTGEHPTFGPQSRLKTLAEIARDNDPREAAKVFNVYLFLSKIHPNPVFAGLEQALNQMRSVKLADIGVLACSVRLQDDDEYLAGEREFRVPAARVESVKRIF